LKKEPVVITPEKLVDVTGGGMEVARAGIASRSEAKTSSAYFIKILLTRFCPT
jgi:hypothetical protein